MRAMGHEEPQINFDAGEVTLGINQPPLQLRAEFFGAIDRLREVKDRVEGAPLCPALTKHANNIVQCSFLSWGLNEWVSIPIPLPRQIPGKATTGEGSRSREKHTSAR